MATIQPRNGQKQSDVAFISFLVSGYHGGSVLLPQLRSGTNLFSWPSLLLAITSILSMVDATLTLMMGLEYELNPMITSVFGLLLLKTGALFGFMLLSLVPALRAVKAAAIGFFVLYACIVSAEVYVLWFS
jgi:hypothetical protein